MMLWLQGVFGSSPYTDIQCGVFLASEQKLTLVFCPRVHERSVASSEYERKKELANDLEERRVFWPAVHSVLQC